eukprot:CAMPEP_0179032650 /NCGR_PEP_ID=MMETSP0796-20121207/11695_1 /TAXON_ID=73915 /ORGANISM="Pyrodinium bahamense, Strain pbaha01" /LENGTH=106 /DNA_ID=CAMNT_0020728879 /DNA_START=1 /DNA_END=317 /DNA_ORIENTATION=-
MPCYKAAIAACSNGLTQKAVDLLQEMQEQDLAPGTSCYLPVIDACVRDGLLEHALRLTLEMRQRGLEPSVVAYDAAIQMSESTGQWSLAIELLQEVRNPERWLSAA